MNQNLHILLDKLTVAPAETKCEIVAILASEGCLTVGSFSAKIAAMFLHVVGKLAGKEKVKNIIKNKLLEHPEQVDEVFFEIIDDIVEYESLSMIQDFLYAVYLSKWKFDPNDAKTYLEKIFSQTISPK